MKFALALVAVLALPVLASANDHGHAATTAPAAPAAATAPAAPAASAASTTEETKTTKKTTKKSAKKAAAPHADGSAHVEGDGHAH